MNIVTTTSVFPPGYPAENALARLAAVGYTHLDMAFDYCTHPDFPFMGEGFRAWAEDLRRRADALGVRYTHAHACGGATSRAVAYAAADDDTLGCRSYTYNATAGHKAPVMEDVTLASK